MPDGSQTEFEQLLLRMLNRIESEEQLSQLVEQRAVDILGLHFELKAARDLMIADGIDIDDKAKQVIVDELLVGLRMRADTKPTNPELAELFQGIPVPPSHPRISKSKEPKWLTAAKKFVTGGLVLTACLLAMLAAVRILNDGVPLHCVIRENVDRHIMVFETCKSDEVIPMQMPTLNPPTTRRR
jgi:hypothetical protein